MSLHTRTSLLLPLFCTAVMLVAIVPTQTAQAAGSEKAGGFTDHHIDPQGNAVECDLVPGSPPPPEYLRFISLNVKEGTEAGAVLLPDVPAFNWCYGCSSTAAAMLAGYYDQPAQGFCAIYSGPSNSGVCPLDNQAWWANVPYPTLCSQAVTCGSCPLVATRNGLDGRTTRGSVDDYWRAFDCAGDAYAGHWDEHTADCLADFMGTSQWVKFGSGYENPDGSTSFWYNTDNSPLHDYTGMEPLSRDGCHGMRLFFQSRGYPVTTNFNQRPYGFNGIQAGFTWEQYKTEIDAGRPVLIHVTGHTMTGVGYNQSGRMIYLHNTWDRGLHSMTWGGSYYGMQHRGVTVLRPTPLPTSVPTLLYPPDGSTLLGSAVAFHWLALTCAAQYRLQVNTNPAFTGTPACDQVVSDTAQNVTFRGNPGALYWRVYACNEGGIWSSPSPAWSFRFAGPAPITSTPASSSATVPSIAPPPAIPLTLPAPQSAVTRESAQAAPAADAGAEVLLAFSLSLLGAAALLGLGLLALRGRRTR